jgi:phenylpyruvate tautomerase PptA (4-oxalocrotonate tautomerase family)
MPYLQLDLPASYPAATKKALARRLGDLYAEAMQTTASMVSVGFRELGEGSLYRCGAEAPQPAAVIQCDIRSGRAADQRLAFAARLVEECVEHLGLPPDRVAVEFTQHTGDEMYRDGSWGRDWMPSEAGEPRQA